MGAWVCISLVVAYPLVKWSANPPAHVQTIQLQSHRITQSTHAAPAA